MCLETEWLAMEEMRAYREGEGRSSRVDSSKGRYSVKIRLRITWRCADERGEEKSL